MSEEKIKDNFVNITDCLEAVSVFKASKNFLFFIILLGMIIMAACFILADLGLVKEKMPKAKIVAVEIPIQNQSQQITEEIKDANSPIKLVASAVEKITMDANTVSAEVNNQTTPQQTTEVAAPAESKKIKVTIDFIYINWLVKVCDYLLIISAALYCLVLIFSLKVSMLGNLGGINHIARAFILSLFLIVFLYPWQKMFGPADPIVVGAIYLPKEILEIVRSRADFDMIQIILHYLRFAGWWIISLAMLLATQRRSARWAKATLRRLGIE